MLTSTDVYLCTRTRSTTILNPAKLTRRATLFPERPIKTKFRYEVFCSLCLALSYRYGLLAHSANKINKSEKEILSQKSDGGDLEMAVKKIIINFSIIEL